MGATPHGTTVERVADDLDAGFASGDLDRLLALFAPDATIESHLVKRVFDRAQSVCRGHDEIRRLLGALLERGRPWGGHRPPMIRGDTVAVEFTTRSSPDETFSVDVIEVREGKIKSLRAYSGWRAVV